MRYQRIAKMWHKTFYLKTRDTQQTDISDCGNRAGVTSLKLCIKWLDVQGHTIFNLKKGVL